MFLYCTISFVLQYKEVCIDDFNFIYYLFLSLSSFSLYLSLSSFSPLSLSFSFSLSLFLSSFSLFLSRPTKKNREGTLAHRLSPPLSFSYSLSMPLYLFFVLLHSFSIVLLRLKVPMKAFFHQRHI